MSHLEILSLLSSAALGSVCVLLVARAYHTGIAHAADMQLARKEIAASRGDAEVVRRDYLALARGVAETLNEIRRDIDRNYQHTHEGHLLDRVAYEFKCAGGPIRLGPRLADDVRAAGGAKFIVDGQMLFGDALNLAWHLHAQAREKAEALYAITRESCGDTDRAAWLAKTLALYERINGWDKDAAISSLENVLDLWRHYDVDLAVRQTRFLNGG